MTYNDDDAQVALAKWVCMIHIPGAMGASGATLLALRMVQALPQAVMSALVAWILAVSEAQVA